MINIPYMSEEQTQATETKEVPAKFKDLVTEIEKMSVLDLSELVKVLEDKFGVSAAAPAMMMAAGVAGGAAAAEEGPSTVNVELTGFGENKIAVIKAVRTLTGLGLAEAKAMVDGVPHMLKEGVEKAAAEDIKKQIEEAGGTVAFK